ncbi:MAG: ABC transporter permease [Bacilli bacterium]|nr:ABC transporter permease [Bacilli bacterium]MDD4388346.1 ABC transporter permease [Bacilli bacterium]
MNKVKEHFKRLLSNIGKWFKSLFVRVEDNDAKLLTLYKKPQTKSILSSLISIFIGILLGGIILYIMALASSGISLKAAWDGFRLIFIGVFNTGRNAQGKLTFGFNGTNIGNVFFRATPIILTGLSVAVAFKTGLFNIGAPGQYLLGTATTYIVALSIPTAVVPAWIVWTLAFLAGILGGALWGVIPGLFKSLLNINEVITCIMTNWIAANLVTALFDNNTGVYKHLLDPSPTKNFAYLYKTTYNGVATSKMGLDKLFPGSQVNGGIIIAIVIAVLIYIILNKTTFGYQLKACGYNRHAAKYAGINEKINIVYSMAIAGGLAGAGAALYYLSGNTEFYWSTYQALPTTGFNGIPVALLAYNNPIGVIFSGVFMSYLNVAGLQLKNLTPFNEFITDIIIASIVYLSAFSLAVKDILTGKFFKKRGHIVKIEEEKAVSLKTNENTKDKEVIG